MAKNDVVATPKKVKTAKQKKPKASPQHPKVAEMVNTAISFLKDRKGSSLQAIKKYIASQYKVDVQKISPKINKYLKNSVESGTLIQTKGKGASGSFIMASHTKEKAKPKSAAPKTKKADKPKTPKKASLTKSPKESETTKPKARKISGVMSCRGSMFAPSRSEIMKVEAAKSQISGIMKNGSTKAPNKKSKSTKTGVAKSKNIAGVMKVGGTKAPSAKNKK